MGPKNPRSKQPGTGTQGPLKKKEHTQPQGDKKLEQLTCKSNIAEDMMSAMVKLAKDPLELHDTASRPRNAC